MMIRLKEDEEEVVGKKALSVPLQAFIFFIIE
jgi:hypothetical protein